MHARRQPIVRLLMLAAVLISFVVHAAPPPLVVSVDSKGKKQIQVAGKKDKERAIVFEVRVQNPLTTEVKCKLEWYFVASLDKGFGYFVSDQGSEEITIPPRGTVSTNKQSLIAVSAKAEDKSAKTKKFVQASAETKGYIVRVSVGEEVIAVFGEPSFIKRRIEDPDTFRDLLSAIPELPPPPPPPIKFTK